VNLDIEKIGPCRNLLRAEIDPETVQSTYDLVVADYQKKAQLPGFRPGKVPKETIAKTFSKSIEADTRKKLVDKAIDEATKSKNLRLLTVLNVEDGPLNIGQAFSFVATIDVEPEFDLPEYKRIPVRLKKRQVENEDIKHALDVLREDAVEFKSTNQPSKVGDYLVVDYTVLYQNQPLSNIFPLAKQMSDRQGFWININGKFVNGIDLQLVGLKPGDKKDVDTDLPEDFFIKECAGKKVTFHFEIKSVLEKFYRSDEELAKYYGARNFDELLEGVKLDLQKELERTNKSYIKSQILSYLSSKVDFELPETLLDSETRSVLGELIDSELQRGSPADEIMKSKDAFMDAAKNRAKERLKISFILHKIARQEKIQVTTQEILENIAFIAKLKKISYEKAIEQIKKNDELIRLTEDIVLSKVIDLLVKNSVLVEDDTVTNKNT